MASNAVRRAVVSPEQKPAQARPRRFKVADNPNKNRRSERFKWFKRLLVFVLIVGLASSVLYTQAKITEVQNRIEQQTQEYQEQVSLNEMLLYEIESRIRLQDIEERARQLGLVKRQPSQTVYIRMEENNVEEKPPGLWKIIQEQVESFLNWLGL